GDPERLREVLGDVGRVGGLVHLRVDLLHSTASSRTISGGPYWFTMSAGMRNSPEGSTPSDVWIIHSYSAITSSGISMTRSASRLPAGRLIASKGRAASSTRPLW